MQPDDAPLSPDSTSPAACYQDAGLSSSGDAPPAPAPAHPPLGAVGLHPAVPEEAYHAGPGVSASALKVFADAPAKTRVPPAPPSDAQRLGTAVHRIILEPGRAEADYVVFEHGGSTKEGKAERAAAAGSGREGITRAKMDMALACAGAIAAHPLAGMLLAEVGPADRELTGYWTDPATGLLCRMRIDALFRRGPYLLDIKTAETGEPRDFGRAAARFRYHWSAAHYLRGAAALGLAAEAMIFVVVEKEPPYLVACYDVEQDDLSRANAEIDEQLARWAGCERTGVWPGYGDHLMKLRLPAWATVAASDL